MYIITYWRARTFASPLILPQYQNRENVPSTLLGRINALKVESKSQLPEFTTTLASVFHQFLPLQPQTNRRRMSPLREEYMEQNLPVQDQSLNKSDSEPEE